MSRKRVVFALLVVVVALVGIGCVEENPLDPQEKIIFQNRSGVDGVACYIDDELKGTVNNGQELEVEGDYEGDRELRATEGDLVWGPRAQRIERGMIFTWELGI